MCGLVGIISNSNVSDMIMESLQRLAYRGYDSSGIAIHNAQQIKCVRSPGKLDNLRAMLNAATGNMNGGVGIGHTRWATHGAPSDVRNAHPHANDKVAVVHNGIIENFQELKDELTAQGATFITDTDSEVIPWLITLYIENMGLSKKDALLKVIDRLEGSVSMLVLFKDEVDLLIAAKKNAPLVLGYGQGYMCAASDSYAIAPWTNRVTYLEDGDVALMTRQGIEVFNTNGGELADRQIKTIATPPAPEQRGQFAHYMLKEIHDQTHTIRDALIHYHDYQLPVKQKFAATRHIRLIGCGSAYYACKIGQWYIANIARVHTSAEAASEFRYSDVLTEENDLSIFVSQSGETADTIAAMRYAKELGHITVGLLNNTASSLANEVEYVLPTLAGQEISVATTKVFTAQLVVLCVMAMNIAKARGIHVDPSISRDLISIPMIIEAMLARSDNFNDAAKKLSNVSSALFIGRGVCYSVALEGALKLREVAYVHSEAIAAGELKHGSIALIEASLPVVALCPGDMTFNKMCSNIQEIKARSGFVIAITDNRGQQTLSAICDCVIVLPSVGAMAIPIVYSVAMQILAYQVGVYKGTDIDQPRNLAKSVTVE